MTVNVSDNRYGVARLIVAPTIAEGANYSTIASALTAAVAGQTIFLRPGTYTENITLKDGVNLVAFQGDQSTPNVIINGTCSFSSAGTVTLGNIRLRTNSANCLSITGSAASIVNLNGCYIDALNNTAIAFSSSSASAKIMLNGCTGNIATTGIAYFSDSSAGMLEFNYCNLFNSGNSTTANTKSAGQVIFRDSTITNPITTSSTGVFVADYTSFNCNVINATALTHGGALSQAIACTFSGGTASAISVSSGSVLGTALCNIASSNTNAVTGVGTFNHHGLTFSDSSQTINTTTQTVAGVMKGSTVAAPTIGMIGEQIRATVASGSAVNLPVNTTTNITSISVTAGIWDISGLIQGTYTGLSGFFIGGISTTSATLGTSGDNYAALTLANITGCSISIPSWRLSVTTTTTVYLVAQSNFSTGASTGYGRISATRVG